MLSEHKNGVTLAVKLTPNASKNAFVRIEMDSTGKTILRASVTVIPEKGKANAALIKLMSQKLNLPKSMFQIIAGQLSQHKSILISGNTEALALEIPKKLEKLGLKQG